MVGMKFCDKIIIIFFVLVGVGILEKRLELIVVVIKDFELRDFKFSSFFFLVIM